MSRFVNGTSDARKKYTYARPRTVKPATTPVIIRPVLLAGVDEIDAVVVVGVCVGHAAAGAGAGAFDVLIMYELGKNGREKAKGRYKQP